MSIGVYIIRNLEANKCYIGSSINIEYRFRRHILALQKNKHHSVKLQRSWNLHKEDNFVFEILEITDKKDLLIREQYYIDLYKSYEDDKGYNICPLAGNTIGRKTSQTTIEKLKISSSGRKHTEETKKIISKKLKNRVVSEETKEKLSTIFKEKFKNPENHPFYGKTHIQETIDKIKQTLSEKMSGENNPFYGKTHSMETRKFLSDINTGKPLSEECKKNMSKAHMKNLYSVEEIDEKTRKDIYDDYTSGMRIIDLKLKYKFSTYVIKKYLNEMGINTGDKTGSRNPSAKMSFQTAEEIRKKHFEEKISVYKLSKNYNVCYMTIKNIILNKTWINQND